MHGNIPCMDSNWANLVVHLLLKGSMAIECRCLAWYYKQFYNQHDAFKYLRDCPVDMRCHKITFNSTLREAEKLHYTKASVLQHWSKD